VVYRPMSLS